MSRRNANKNAALARHFARLVRLVADRPEAEDAHRAQAQVAMLTAPADGARLAPGPRGRLLLDGAAVTGRDLDVALLAERLGAFRVEELRITARATVDDLCALARALGATPPAVDASAWFAAQVGALDAEALPLRVAGMSERPVPAPPPAAEPVPEPVPEPAPEPEREPVPDARARLDALAHAIDLAHRTGAPDEFLARFAELVAFEEAELERDASDETRQRFAHAIRRLAKPVILREVAVLRHRRATEPGVVAQAQAVLERYGRDGAEALIDEHGAAATLEAQAACVAALRAHPVAYDALMLLTRDPLESAVRHAVAILGALREPRAEELLHEVLPHPDARTRRAAVAALAQFRSEEAGAAIALAAQDESPLVRARAVAALVDRREGRAVEVLSALLRREPDAEVLYAAMGGLGALGGPEAVQALIPAAQGEGEHPRHRDAEFRIQACTALVAIRTPQAMACVQALRDDRDREVREASVRLVAQAARRATGAMPVVQG